MSMKNYLLKLNGFDVQILKETIEYLEKKYPYTTKEIKRLVRKIEEVD